MTAAVETTSPLAGDANKIEEFLAALPAARLKALAARRGVETRGTTRDELVQRVAVDLTSPRQMANALAGCSPVQRTVLHYILLWDGQAPLTVALDAANRFATTMTGEGPAGSPSATGEQPTLIDELADAGLLLVGTAPISPPGDHDGWTSPRARAGWEQMPSPGNGSAADWPAGLAAPTVAYLPLALRSVLEATPALPSSTPAPQGSLPLPAPPPLLALVMLCWKEVRDGRFSPATPRRTHPIERYYLHLQGWYNVADELERLAGPSTGRWHPLDATTILSVAQPPVGLAQEDRRRLMLEAGCSERQLAFAVRLLRALGLISTIPTGFAAHPDGMMAFLARSVPERLHWLARAWLADTSWSELFQVRDLNVGRHAGDAIYKQDTLLADLARGRRFIARFLGRLDADAWYSFQDILQGLRGLEPNLPGLRVPVTGGRVRAGRQGRATPSSVASSASQSGQKAPWVLRTGAHERILQLSQETDWRTAVGGFLARIMLGPLQWLGAMELALSPVHETLPDDKAIIAVRLTTLGRALLSPVDAAEDAGTPPACACLDLDDDLFVSPIDETPAAVHGLLRHFGTPSLGQDVSLRYRLEPQWLAQATHARAAAETLVSLLEQHCREPISPAAWSTVRGWRDRAGQVLLYPHVTVVEVADTAAVQEVWTMTDLRQVLLCRLSEHSFLIDSAAAGSVVAKLTARGYTPRLRQYTP